MTIENKNDSVTSVLLKSGDVKIKAIFEINKYKVTLTKGEYIKSVIADKDSVEHGGSVKIIAVPEDWYKFWKWEKVSGSCNITDASKCTTTVTNVTSDVVIKGVGKVITFMKVYGGDRYDEGRGIIITSDGKYIVVGNSNSFGDGFGDIYLLKLDINGDSLWDTLYNTKFHGGAIISSYTKTLDGGLIVVGGTYYQLEKGTDVGIVKISSNFSIELDTTYGRVGDDKPYSIYSTSEGGFIIGGSTFSGDPNVYLCKINNKGFFEWDSSYGGENVDIGYSVIQTKAGDFIVSGISNSFSSEERVFIINIDKTGKIKWENTYLDGGKGVSIFQTTDGGFFVIATISSNSVGNNLYLLKLNSSGTVEWGIPYVISVGGGLNYLMEPKSIQTFDNGFVVVGTTIFIENRQQRKG